MATWLDRLIKPSPTRAAPTHSESQRNDLLVAATVLFAIFLAFGIRGQVYGAGQAADLGVDMPRIAYPDRWTERQTEDLDFRAVNLGDPSTFDARMEVTSRLLRQGESLDRARADRALKLATGLQAYRELEADRMVVYDDEPALVTTYSYVADPTRDSGANGLPVVVEARDIMFLYGSRFVVVTLASDATEWDDAARDLRVITESLDLQPADGPALATPLAPAASESFTGGQSATTPTEGGD